jgi:hypothetical protein
MEERLKTLLKIAVAHGWRCPAQQDNDNPANFAGLKVETLNNEPYYKCWTVLYSSVYSLIFRYEGKYKTPCFIEALLFAVTAKCGGLHENESFIEWRADHNITHGYGTGLIYSVRTKLLVPENELFNTLFTIFNILL